MGIERRRWVNPAQPQTLQIAVLLLYLNAAFTVIFQVLPTGSLSWLLLLFVAGGVLAGFGIANEKKWGYGLGIAMAVFPFALRFYVLGNPFEGTNILTLMFDVALVALLLHPQSRDYQRIWFK